MALSFPLVMALYELESFFDADMKNILRLFHNLNQGTHGTAGRFDILQAQAIRRRVEGPIMFLSRLID